VIKNLVFDCDGTLTDGKYYYSKEGKELITFHANDSLALTMARRDGLNRLIMISSASYHDINKKRATDTNVEYVEAPVGDKLPLLCQMVDMEETAYIGDALDDIDAIKAARLGFTPISALDEVKESADIVLKRRGGEGCLLEMYIMVRDYNEKVRRFQEHSS
jgi:YrbI family 3-deoxy-D-manno-octulosonate 8-phosphate phosphatase